MTLPANSTIHLAGTADKQDIAFATVEGMLTPTTLDAVGPGAAPCAVQALPAQFDASQIHRRPALRDVEGRHARALFPGPQEGRSRPEPAC